MTGGTLSYIGESIHTQYPNWLLTANTLAVTAVCPFVGYVTDLLGRRYVAIFGSILLVIASVVQAASMTLGSSVTAQALGGIGAGICELTALAGVAEITRKLPSSDDHLLLTRVQLSAGEVYLLPPSLSRSCRLSRTFSTSKSSMHTQPGAGHWASLPSGTVSEPSESSSAISRLRVTTSMASPRARFYAASTGAERS